MSVTIPQPLLIAIIGLFFGQLIAFAGFQIRQFVQANIMAKKVEELVVFKEAVETGGVITGRDLNDIKMQQAVQREQTQMIVSALAKVESKVDTLIEKVAKQDGRSGRGS